MGTEVTMELQLEQMRQVWQGYLDYESNGPTEKNTPKGERERERERTTELQRRSKLSIAA